MQLPLDKESQDICSFSSPLGNFSCKNLVQGDTNAVNVAQKLLMEIIGDIAFSLIDDIAMADEELETHLEKLETLLERLASVGLTLRADKVEILATRLDYLGFSVENGVLRISDDKVNAVRTWPRPRSVSEVRAFLGFTSFVRRFIRAYSEIARPLFQLTKKESLSADDWSPEAESAFVSLKEAITSEPCLMVPDPDGGEYHLFSDASETSIAFVLSQKTYCEVLGKEVLKPCVYGSRLFRGAEKNYSIPEKEILAATWSIQRCRPYLALKRFKLHVDSESVYHVLRKSGTEEMTGRLARFAYDVLSYSFDTCHVRSKKNWADALSRLPVVKGPTGELQYRRDEVVNEDPFPPPPDPKEVDLDPIWVSLTRGQALEMTAAPGLREEQRNDPELGRIIDEVVKSKDGLVRKGRMSFSRKGGALVVDDGNDGFRLVIPEKLRRRVLVDQHTLAHLGADKMLMNMGKSVYWVGMAEAVKDFVRNCIVCQTHKPKPMKVVPLGKFLRPKRPQQNISIDVKGPLPRSHGCSYIIVAVDLFSRYSWTRACSHVDGKEVADFFLDQVFPFGLVEVVLSDNAPNLAQGLSHELLKRCGVNHLNSIPYLPSSNGSVERVISTLGSMLRCASERNPQDWARVIPVVTDIYNHSVHRATGYKPFHLHFSYEARTLKDLEGPRPDEGYGTPQQYLYEQKKRRDDALEAVRLGLERYYEDIHFSREEKVKPRPHQFQVGDWVMVKDLAPSGESKALKRLFVGPAEVMKVTDALAEIAFIVNGQRFSRSVNHLRPFYEDKRNPTDPALFSGLKRGKRTEAGSAEGRDGPDDTVQEGQASVGPSVEHSGFGPEILENSEVVEVDEDVDIDDVLRDRNREVHFDLPSEEPKD